MTHPPSRGIRAAAPWQRTGALLGLLALLLGLLGVQTTHRGVQAEGFLAAEVCTSAGARAAAGGGGGRELPGRPDHGSLPEGCDWCVASASPALPAADMCLDAAPATGLAASPRNYRGPSVAPAVWPDTRSRAPPGLA